MPALKALNKHDAADLAWATSFLWDLDQCDISRSGMSRRETRSANLLWAI